MKQVKRIGILVVAVSVMSICLAHPTYTGASGNIVASPDTSTAK